MSPSQHIHEAKCTTRSENNFNSQISRLPWSLAQVLISSFTLWKKKAMKKKITQTTKRRQKNKQTRETEWEVVLGRRVRKKESNIANVKGKTSVNVTKQSKMTYHSIADITNWLMGMWGGRGGGECVGKTTDKNVAEGGIKPRTSSFSASKLALGAFWSAGTHNAYIISVLTKIL